MCGTRILKCSCKSSFQDAQYGQGWRLHNMNGANDWWEQIATCTVCGNKKEEGETLKTKEWLTEHSGWVKR